jgi:hypothetical protein
MIVRGIVLRDEMEHANAEGVVHLQIWEVRHFAFGVDFDQLPVPVIANLMFCESRT